MRPTPARSARRVVAPGVSLRGKTCRRRRADRRRLGASDVQVADQSHDQAVLGTVDTIRRARRDRPVLALPPRHADRRGRPARQLRRDQESGTLMAGAKANHLAYLGTLDRRQGQHRRRHRSRATTTASASYQTTTRRRVHRSDSQLVAPSRSAATRTSDPHHRHQGRPARRARAHPGSAGQRRGWPTGFASRNAIRKKARRGALSEPAWLAHRRCRAKISASSYPGDGGIDGRRMMSGDLDSGLVRPRTQPQRRKGHADAGAQIQQLEPGKSTLTAPALPRTTADLIRPALPGASRPPTSHSCALTADALTPAQLAGHAGPGQRLGACAAASSSSPCAREALLRIQHRGTRRNPRWLSFEPIGPPAPAAPEPQANHDGQAATGWPPSAPAAEPPDQARRHRRPQATPTAPVTHEPAPAKPAPAHDSRRRSLLLLRSHVEPVSKPQAVAWCRPSAMRSSRDGRGGTRPEADKNREGSGRGDRARQEAQRAPEE